MSPQILADRFEIAERLSHTDFMSVYLARDRHYLHRPNCIVKSVNYRHAHMRHRIEREVQTLELLGEHPQIPSILAYFHTGKGKKQTEEQTFYVVQSWLGGHPLSKELVAGRPLSEGYVSKLLKDVLVPLARVHEQGVVHQNIHPQHLIRREMDGQIFLTEFGTLPKLARSRLNEAGELTTSIPVSPQPYSSPELLQQNPQPASDLYSLGLIAIEALTGSRHQDLSFDSVKGLLWRDRVSTGSGADGSVSLSLAEFIDRLVRHEWRDRFENAREALSHLKTVQSRQQIALDSRFPTAVVAPGKQATAFGQAVGANATALTQSSKGSRALNRSQSHKPKNNLPYPLNLAVGGKPAGGGTTRNTAQYGKRQSNPYLVKWVIGSLAALLAVGVGVKTYQWGEHRISRLPQSWSDWAETAADPNYPAADVAQLVPLFSEGDRVLLQPAAANAYWEMYAAAADDGVQLYALSGYRVEPQAMPPATPIDTQDAENQAEDEVVQSDRLEADVMDYQTGYALDIGGVDEGSDRQLSFAKTRAYEWLSENAGDYGFELSSSASPLKRGLLGTDSEQPWHWRYVGDEASQAVFEVSE